MTNRPTPGIDPALAPNLGMTRDGQPLSYNRLAAPDISPWVAWLYAASVDVPDDYQVNCSLFNDTAMIRIQLRGDWSAQTRDGPLRYSREAVYCGPQRKSMPVSVRGSFTSVGFALKPGAGVTVTGLPASDFVDRIVTCDSLGLPGGAALGMLDPDATPEDWLQTLEAMARGVLALRGAQPPDPVSERFEILALTAPSTSIAEFAEDCAISQRRLERICRRDFGMAPKQVLRRARALDMASSLRGVADRDEAEEIELRYYDQSHLIREFTELFGMSPRQFVTTPQPLMTLALESRQSRRLAILDRLPTDAPRPWAAPA